MIAVSEIGVSRTPVAEPSCRPRVRPNTLPPVADVDAGDEHPVVAGELGFERGADRVHGAEDSARRRPAAAGSATRRSRRAATKSVSVAAVGLASRRAASTASSSSSRAPTTRAR